MLKALDGHKKNKAPQNEILLFLVDISLKRLDILSLKR